MGSLFLLKIQAVVRGKRHQGTTSEETFPISIKENEYIADNKTSTDNCKRRRQFQT